MADEVQEWKDFADEMFGSFGNVIRDAEIEFITQGSYNRNTGTYDETITLIETKAVGGGEIKSSFLERDQGYPESMYVFLIRGSDFTSPPVAGRDRLIIDPGLTSEQRYVIMKVGPDSVNIGAFFELKCSRQ